jgi:hypothetical protein
MKHYTHTEKNNGELAVRWLSEKAQRVYRETDPLDIFEIETDEGKRYDVAGMVEARSLTFEELEEFLESVQDEFDAMDD